MGFKGRKPRDLRMRRFAAYDKDGVVWGLGLGAERAMRDGIGNGGKAYSLKTAPATRELCDVVYQEGGDVPTRLRADGVLELAGKGAS